MNRNRLTKIGNFKHFSSIDCCDENVLEFEIAMDQTARPRRLNEKLWHEMLRGKTLNQSRVLQHKKIRSAHLELALRNDEFDEGNCARRYWQLFFPSIGWTATRRDRKDDNAPNQMLNYGYAVLSALCHRSLIVHGLLPQMGVHHMARYRSDPLVYDLMECFRPAVELMLAEFMLEPDVKNNSLTTLFYCTLLYSSLEVYLCGTLDGEIA